MKKRVFYKKLLFTYISIIVIYTSISVAVFSVITRNYNENQWHAQNQLYIEQIAYTVDTKLDIATGLMKQMFVSPEVSQFITQDETDYYTITLIFNQMREYLTPFDYLGIYMAIGRAYDNQVISSDGTIKEESFFRKMNFPFGDKDALYKYLDDNTSRVYTTVTSKSGYYGNLNDYLTLINLQKFSGGRRMITYLTFLEKTVFQPVIDRNEGILVVCSGNQIISHRQHGLNEQDVQYILNKFEASGSNAATRFEAYNVYEAKSSVIDWEYYYLVPEHINARNSINLLLKSTLIFQVLLLLGVVIAIFTAKKTYNPVYQIIKRIGDEDTVDSVNEFDFIEKMSINMKEVNASLRRTIESDQISLKRKFIRDLLYGLVLPENFDGLVDKYDFNIEPKDVGVLLIEYDNFEELHGKYSENKYYSLRLQVNTILREALDTKGRIELLEMDQKRIVLLVNQRDYKESLEKLNNILANVEFEYGITLTCAAGKMMDSMQSLSMSYADAIEVLEYKNMIPEKRIIDRSDLGDVVSSNYYYPINLEQNLMNYVLQDRQEEVNMILKHLIRENFENRQLSSENHSLLVFAIVGTINRLINIFGKSANEIFDDGFISYIELKTIASEVKFEKKIFDIFNVLSEHAVVRDRQHSDNKMANKILEYIHLNYMYDISLQELANHFNITPAYVSMLFKKEHQYNFKDYLNMFRVKKAKEFMEHDATVKNTEIAEMVGFNSVNTFLRIFKKYEGISPGRYMKNINKE